MRIYLDACCYCRPFDNQRIDRNRLEAEAVLGILARVHGGGWTLVGSDVIDDELAANPDDESRDYAIGLTSLAQEHVAFDGSHADRATAFVAMGVATRDALHLATAEAAQCAVVLTTDDRLLRKAMRNRALIQVHIANPLDWLREQIDDGND